MLVIARRSTFAEVLKEVQADATKQVEKELSGIRSVTDLSAKVKELREQIATLEIAKSKQTEDHARKEREIEHKVGLERKRQEFELESGKRDATLKVREENLTADRKRFEEQMKFQEERFTKEVGYLKDMLSQIVRRLPSAEFTADLTPATTKRGRNGRSE